MTKEQNYELLLKRSLQAIRILEDKLARRPQASKEPIAIIGMGCRMPGGCAAPEAFWEFLKQGKDGIRDVPPERWPADDYYDPDPAVPGKTYVKRAGFLCEDVGLFDARFFGISPREAMELDPQQRLLLEVSWEALERAGVTGPRLKGSRTGVFIGISGSEFVGLAADPERTGPYTATGFALNIASGRIAHTFGFHGPAISIDTACSSSLVAVHLACTALGTGDCDLALAGGVNLMFSPQMFIMLSKINALARDGRCKTFDTSGDGYVRGEGCGLVVLKRLSDALKENDIILAVIKGSASNQDGVTSALTVPNGLAQQQLIHRALEDAGVSPADIGFLETHGTGTSLGDPIEVQSLSEIFAGHRDKDYPLVLGAVKSNIGHLEAAAGITGLIKAVLCLQNKEIPPNLHFKTINPRIDLEKIPAFIPTRAMPWNTDGKPRISGVSAFGFSGTNAHVIAAEAPGREKKQDADKQREVPVKFLHILALSAKDQPALNALTREYKNYLAEHPAAELADLCYTANVCRMHFPYRAVFTAESAGHLVEQLDRYPGGNDSRSMVPGEEGTAVRVAFLFNRHCEDLALAGQEIYKTQPTFKKAFDACAGLCEHYLAVSPAALFGENPPVDARGLKEAGLFCLQYALVQLWGAWGIRPTAVLGEGIGELAAACTAGIMDLDTAVRYVMTQTGIPVHGERAGGVVINPPQMRVISPLSGRPVEKNQLSDADYRQPRIITLDILRVSLQNLVTQDYRCFIEIGAASPLLERASQYVDTEKALAVSSLSTVSPRETLIKSISLLYTAGLTIDWEGFHRDCPGNKIILPTYPFQRRKYWPEPMSAGALAPTTEPAGHPLEGRLLPSPLPEQQFQYRLSTGTFPELLDNRGVLHVGYYQEMLCRIIEKLYHTAAYTIEDMEYYQALYFNSEVPRTVMVVIAPPDDRLIRNFSFYSKEDAQQTWTLHAQGKLEPNKKTAHVPLSREKLTNIKKRCKKVYTGAEFHQKMADHGFILGESVKWVEEICWREREILVRFRKTEEKDKARPYALQFHPGILDACAQVFLVAGASFLDSQDRFMVRRIESFSIDNLQAGDPLWLHLEVDKKLTSENHIRANFMLFDAEQRIVVRVKGQEVKIVSKERSEALEKALGDRDSHVQYVQGQDRLLREKLAVSNPQEQKNIMKNYLAEVMAKLLCMKPAEILPDEPLVRLGMDSVMGLELKNIINKDLDVEIPMEYILRGPSLSELSGSLMRLVFGDTSPDSSEAGWYSHQYKMDLESWLEYRQERPAAKIRLFCFPYGVVGASLFRAWPDQLADAIEVCPIQMPGKENRINERPIDNIDELTGVMEQVLAPLMDRPFAVYGHSVGALIAYRFAYHLWKKKIQQLRHLFVGAYTSAAVYPNPVIERVMGALKTLGFEGIPGSDQLLTLSPQQRLVFEQFFQGGFHIVFNDEMRRAMRPVALSEFRIVDSYTYDKNETRFDVPITAFHGQDDIFVTTEEMEAWQPLTTGPFNVHVLPGDHLFLRSDQGRSQLLTIIHEQLKSYIDI